MIINWGALGVVAVVSLVVAVLIVVLVSSPWFGFRPASPTDQSSWPTGHWSSLAPGAACPAPRAR